MPWPRYGPYSRNHLGLCRMHFAIAAKITISRIKAVFLRFRIRSFGNLKLKRATVIYNVIIVCFK